MAKAEGFASGNLEDKVDRSKPDSLLRDITKSSLQIGIIITGVWILIILLLGPHDLSSAAGIRRLLGNAIFILVVFSIFAFIFKVSWAYSRRKLGLVLEKRKNRLQKYGISSRFER